MVTAVEKDDNDGCRVKNKKSARTGHNGTKKVHTDKNSCGDSSTGSIMTR